MNQDQFNQKLKDKFPHEKYKVVRYGKNSNEDTEIICLSCRRHIIVNTGELFRNRRKNICSKCNYLRKDSKENREKTIKLLEEQNICEYSFYFKKQKSNIRIHRVNWICPKCDRSNDQNVVDVLRNKVSCGHCEQKLHKDTVDCQHEIENRFPNRFLILDEYNTTKNKIKVKCLKCGFIRKVSFTSLLRYGYCPKCGKTKSHGERFIGNWLELKNIEFETQKYFKEWNIGIHYFDFFIPSKNLVIEFHGSQHYTESSYFDCSLEETTQKDLIKKQACLDNKINYCSIKYSCIDNIDSILSFLFNSTTIPEGSRGKCFEIETIQDLDKDIV